jgi:glycine/D-amino acid oxidase-like deaminating enzyme
VAPDGSNDGGPARRTAYHGVSLWLETCHDDLRPRAPLTADTDVDVAIVGAGYTGLWTAYYLALADPTLRIAVLEREIAGFGASGRNGGWCSAEFAASRTAIARKAGRDAALAMQAAMIDTVGEVGRVAATERIDCGFHRGGTLRLATSPAHADRLRSDVDEDRHWGLSEEDSQWLGPAEATGRLAATGLRGAVFTPHCARVQPAALARGLARVVERRGVAVYERTAVAAIEPAAAGRPAAVRTAAGARVRAEAVIRATEAYTQGLPGERRRLVPLYSLLIATEPLPAAAWDRIGWAGRETVTDGRHLLIYAQRTADDRIAFGGRGAPYHWGSAVRPRYDRHLPVFGALARTLRQLLPDTRRVAITHRWGGPLGVPRDWHPSVGLDPATGLGWAGGYVGDGVGSANLAGRTLADLVLRRRTDLTRLPWVGHVSPRWEPEPLRWLGINASRLLAASADAAEARTGRPARRAELLDRLTGSG